MSFTLAKMQQAARDIDNLNTGYDQWERWSFFNRATHTIIPNKEGDCSSVCGAIAALAGSGIDLSDYFYTGTFRTRALATGKFKAIPFTSLSQVQAGDFLLNETHHVEFAYTATTFFSANADENGRASGGKAGDQTGKEVYFKPAFNYSRGWQYIIRPIFSSTTTTKPLATIAQEVINGSWGNDPARSNALRKAGYNPATVQAEVNRILKGNASNTAQVTKIAKEVIAGSWGNGAQRIDALRKAGHNPTTIQAEVNKLLKNKPNPPSKTKLTAVQAAVRAVQDNVSGPDTKKRVNAVRTSSNWWGKQFPYGINYTQAVVGATQDGWWGPASNEAHNRTVANIQRAVGALVDGTWGPETDRLVKAVVG